MKIYFCFYISAEICELSRNCLALGERSEVKIKYLQNPDATLLLRGERVQAITFPTKKISPHHISSSTDKRAFLGVTTNDLRDGLFCPKTSMRGRKMVVICQSNVISWTFQIGKWKRWQVALYRWDRWSLLLIFGFLCWSSQITEKYGTAMC